MPRANRRRRRDGTDAAAHAGGETTQEWRGAPYVVRRIRGSSSTKAYRCPGCDQEIRPVTPHVVAWPDHDPDAVDRRHWHNACWAAREQRGPRIQRSRDAPRY